jgi:hypothetical protein
MVRFIPVAEESLAWGSKTVAGRISEAVAGDGDGEKERNKVQERRRLKVCGDMLTLSFLLMVERICMGFAN